MPVTSLKAFCEMQKQMLTKALTKSYKAYDFKRYSFPFSISMKIFP